MVLVFQNMYVDVYSLETHERIKEFGPFKSQQIIVDEFCTFLVVLGDNQQRIFYHVFQWDYYLAKLVRPTNMTQSLENQDGKPKKLMFSKAFRES